MPSELEPIVVIDDSLAQLRSAVDQARKPQCWEDGVRHFYLNP